MNPATTNNIVITLGALSKAIFDLVELAESERRLLSQHEAAKVMDVTVQTLHKWRKAGLLGYVPYPGGDIKYRWSHLEEFLINQEVPSKLEAARRRMRSLAA